MDKWRKETNRWQAQHWAVTPSQNRAPGWLLHGPEEANCCESGWIAQKLSRGEAVRAEYRAELDSGGGPQGPSGPGLGSTSPLESSEEREAVAREEGERWPRRFEGSGWVGREHSDGEQGVSGRSCNMWWEQLDKQGEDPADGRGSGKSTSTSWEKSDKHTEEPDSSSAGRQTSRGVHESSKGCPGDRTDTAANTGGVRTVVCGSGCPTSTDGGGRGTGTFRDSAALGTTGL